ncbi:MAG: hypothetical protein ACFE98_13300 [Candidatus Hermodarchaeota archaeon]
MTKTAAGGRKEKRESTLIEPFGNPTLLIASYHPPKRLYKWVSMKDTQKL